MSEPQILVTRRIPEPGLEQLRQSGAHVTVLQPDEELAVTKRDLLDRIGECDVLLCLLTERIDRDVLAANPRLAGVAQMAVGFNNIDWASATEMGIPVSNTPGVLTESTADFTWAMLLSLARRIPEAHNYMVAGRYKLWGPNLLLGSDVGPGADGRKKTLGIVGYGRIGKAVARRAIGFDMEVLAFDPFNREGIETSANAGWADFPDLLARSDFVTLHTPLNADTHHLIGVDELRAMKPTACLVNAARGPIIDEVALVRALREGWIAGAALDVYENEPRMAPGLAECPNAVLLPHIASATTDTRNLMATMAANNAVAHLRGHEAPNVINPDVYSNDRYLRRRRSRE